MRILTISIIFAAKAGAVWASTEVQQLSPEQIQTIRRYVAAETAMPERTRVTGIVAVTSRSGLPYACGYVSWIDSSGLYGPYRHFNGYLGTVDDREHAFAVVEIGRDDDDDRRVQGNCELNGVPLQPVAPEVVLNPSPDVLPVIEQFEGQAFECIRTGGGAESQSQICVEAQNSAKAVYDMGWCDVAQSISGDGFVWQPCN